MTSTHGTWFRKTSTKIIDVSAIIYNILWDIYDDGDEVRGGEGGPVSHLEKNFIYLLHIT